MPQLVSSERERDCKERILSVASLAGKPKFIVTRKNIVV